MPISLAGIVKIRALVFDLRDRAEDAEAVREPGRHVALPEVVGRERDANPSAERRRAAADVDGDVEDLALDDADQLALRPPDLQMQAAQRAADRPRMVVLHERAGDAVLAVRVGVIGLDEEAAVVVVDVGLDDERRPADRSGRRARQRSCSRTRNRYWP